MVKNLQNLPINNLKPDLHNINANWKPTDTYSSYHPETKIEMHGHTIDGQTDEQPM